MWGTDFNQLVLKFWYKAYINININLWLKKSTKDISISIVKVISEVVVFSIVGDGLFSFKFILNLYWYNYVNSGRYFISGCNVIFSLKCILNHASTYDSLTLACLSGISSEPSTDLQTSLSPRTRSSPPTNSLQADDIHQPLSLISFLSTNKWSNSQFTHRSSTCCSAETILIPNTMTDNLELPYLTPSKTH